MFSFSRRSFVCSLVIVFVFIFVNDAFSQSQQQQSRYAIAKRLLSVEFPELASQRMIMCLQAYWDPDGADVPGDFALVLWPGARTCLLTPGTERQYRGGNPVIAGFWFGRDGSLFKYTYRSDLQAGVLNSLLKEIDSHPEWSNEQVLAYVKRADLAFGPGREDRVIEKLKNHDLQLLFGPYSIEYVQFNLRSEGQLSAGLPAAQLYWHVEAKCQRDGGARECYFGFEPEAGKIDTFGIR